MPLAFLGLPSLHDVVEAVAGGFFQTLAEALVPSFLKHASVATIQSLVALPDPAGWGHVGALQEQMVFLGAMLLPVTLAAGTLRWWLVGLTGQAYAAVPLARCVWVTGVLVAYRWIVDQTVTAVNTLTHAVLALPAIGDGLQRLVSILFGGALLTGTGGVFGALLVIVGVLFAAGLFAAQVLVTLALALLIVAGPPLIALSAIPELAHLAGAWGRALLMIALIPFGWTVLFATAGALVLDATSFTGGANGLPGHVAAAFAALITFVLAVRLPWTLLGSLKRLLVPTLSGPAPAGPAAPATGAARATAAFTRLRSTGLHGTLSLGRSAGAAAGALGAPAGGLVGVAARRFGRDPGPGTLRQTGAAAGPPRRAGVRDRLTDAAAIIGRAPSRAREAPGPGSRANKPDSPPSSSRADGRGSERPRPGSAEGKPTAAPPAGARERTQPSNVAAAHGEAQRRGPAKRADSPAGAARRKANPRDERPQAPRPAQAAPQRELPTQGPRQQQPKRPEGRAGSPRRSKGAPPRGRDPVRPPRPRKPDRRPRKKKGPR